MRGSDEGGTRGSDEGGTRGSDEGGTRGSDEGGTRGSGAAREAWEAVVACMSEKVASLWGGSNGLCCEP